MTNKIQLLDCTLRDGGSGLEDAVKNEISHHCFQKDVIEKVISHLATSCIDIIELGSIELSDIDKREFAIYQTIEQVSRTMPEHSSKNQMYAALYSGPDTPLEDIPNWCASYCEIVRVIIRYSELEKSLVFCEGLSKKGYKVSVQPMLTMRYSEEEIQLLINRANAMNAYALYFVDSYGYMQSEDVIRYFKRFNEGLNPSIRIGFHAHNNMNLAFSNTLTFLKQVSKREIIVDSCILGLGLGAGNLQTEIIADFLNKNYRKKYNYSAFLEVCEILERYWTQNVCGYSVTTLLPALHKTAYKYAIVFRNKYKMSYMEINDIFTRMPDELKHRYTKENAINALQICGYNHMNCLNGDI